MILQLFIKTFSKSNGKPERRFFEMFGNVTFEEAYQVHMKKINSHRDMQSKIDAFEKHLIFINAPFSASSVSESRYYDYNGITYRFSSHIHPTGSMTSETKVDFAANPELINNISF